MKDKKAAIMAMNCKQFKHTERVEKKQQYSFNPAEVDYNNITNNNDNSKQKVITRDLSLKKLLLYFTVAIIIASIIKFCF